MEINVYLVLWLTPMVAWWEAPASSTVRCTNRPPNGHRLHPSCSRRSLGSSADRAHCQVRCTLCALLQTQFIRFFSFKSARRKSFSCASWEPGAISCQNCENLKFKTPGLRASKDVRWATEMITRHRILDIVVPVWLQNYQFKQIRNSQTKIRISTCSIRILKGTFLKKRSFVRALKNSDFRVSKRDCLTK